MSCRASRPFIRVAVLVIFAVASVNTVILAAAEPQTIELGSLKLVVPDDWQKQQPKSSIVNYEFSAPAAEGDQAAGRMTVMAAGGGVQANLDRWYGQFKQPDGVATRDKAKVEKKQIAGQEVHIVDISGTFEDKPAPLARAVWREKYRMLAAIVVTQQAEFFIKFTGPENTIAKHRKAFVGMLEDMSAK